MEDQNINSTSQTWQTITNLFIARPSTRRKINSHGYLIDVPNSADSWELGPATKAVVAAMFVTLGGLTTKYFNVQLPTQLATLKLPSKLFNIELPRAVVDFRIPEKLIKSSLPIGLAAGTAVAIGTHFLILPRIGKHARGGIPQTVLCNQNLKKAINDSVQPNFALPSELAQDPLRLKLMQLTKSHFDTVVADPVSHFKTEGENAVNGNDAIDRIQKWVLNNRSFADRLGQGLEFSADFVWSLSSIFDTEAEMLGENKVSWDNDKIQAELLRGLGEEDDTEWTMNVQTANTWDELRTATQNLFRQDG